uniref:DUF6922 domain-containing protein n=1 Tax=Roseivirga sp. TaxID=1964215 RepID=UPI004048278C
MQLSDYLFWDVDKAAISFEEHKGFIIPRVFMRGTLEDFKAVLKYYGKLVCKDQLTQTRYLDKKTLSFCCVFFNLELNQFRCFTERQSNSQHWNY